jgi:hypothetical protein
VDLTKLKINGSSCRVNRTSGNRAGPVVSRIIQKDRVHPRCHRKYTIGEAHVLAADENPSIFDERHEYEFLHGEIPH